MSRFGTKGQAVQHSTALVALETASDREPARLAAPRTNADFIAHLIATATQAPQTRTRRRAEPGEAASAYRTLGQWPSASAGCKVARSL